MRVANCCDRFFEGTSQTYRSRSCEAYLILANVDRFGRRALLTASHPPSPPTLHSNLRARNSRKTFACELFQILGVIFKFLDEMMIPSVLN